LSKAERKRVVVRKELERDILRDILREWPPFFEVEAA
jgi:hypothetical protein